MADVDKIVEDVGKINGVHVDGTARDDAALYEIAPGLLLVATVDFGTPISSNAATWGRIAALNALSDIYAMGARPLVALSVLGWPESVEKSTVVELTQSAAATLAEASATLVGGHTIVSEDPLFGLAVIGIVRPPEAMLIRNARPGQLLILTKPLGSGVVVAAAKAGLAGQESILAAEEVMSQSNRIAAEIAVAAGVRAATDVTGYGLVGHLHNMLTASGSAAVINLARIPILDAAIPLLEDQGIVPNSAERTYFELEAAIHWGTSSWASRFTLCDPQTSGGLLLSASPEAADRFCASCAEQQQYAAVIGEVVSGQAGSIYVQA